MIMRLHEFSTIKPLKPLTPEKAQINALQQQKKRATDALKGERDRQKKLNATKKLKQAQQTLTKI